MGLFDKIKNVFKNKKSEEVEKYDKGLLIKGFENFEGKDDYYCFHAGTKQTDEGIVTNGGRVLGITALGKDLSEARKKAYGAVDWIDFANKYYRHDIGKDF